MKKNSAFSLIFLLALLICCSADAYGKEIHLKSREFVPGEFSDAAKIEKFEEMKRGVRRVHALIQLHHIPDNRERIEIEKSGITLLDYIPDNSWLVSILAETKISKAVRDNILWIDYLTAEDKISPGIRKRGVGQWARRPDGQVILQVRYFRDVTIGEAKAAMESLGVIVQRETPELQTIEIVVEEAKIMKIAGEDVIQWIEEIPPPPVPHNDGSRINTGASIVQAAPYNLTGTAVDIGQWDDGDVDSTHDDFGNPTSRVTEVSNVGLKGNGHATHVAGTMGGSGLLSGGTYKGIAPGINIFSYDFGSNRVTNHDSAINTNGIEISNNSWGLYIYSANCDYYGDYAFDAPNYDKIVTGLYGKKISVVFSAGNERSDGDCPNLTGGGSGYPYYNNITPPATAKNVITAGAINSNNNSMTYFSSWGPVDDGRIKPDVVAPGCQTGGDNGITSTVPTDSYGLMCGTSMSAPAVSGGAALIIQEYRNLYGNKDPLPSTVKALLVHGAQDLGNTGPDYSYGYGKIDLQKSIDTLIGGGVIEDTIDNQKSNFYYLVVPDNTTSIKVTLVWDDEAADPLAARSLVNDLDLILRDPNGVRYYPWTLDPQNPSVAAVRTIKDDTNNIEQIEISNIPLPGTWTVEVFGAAVPVSYLPAYSLVFTPSSFLGVSVTTNSIVDYSSDIPKNIPSGSTGVTSSLLFPDDMIISWINVYVDISRPTGGCCAYTITLTSPGGTSVVLYSGNPGSRTFQTWFDKQTPTKEPLKRFTGESAAGTWLLKVIDSVPGNAAVLNNWGIEVLTTSWAIGSTVSGTTRTMSSTEGLSVRNIGSMPETFTLQVSDPGSWSVATTASGNDVNKFVMNGIFSASTDNAVGESDFNTVGNDDVIFSSSPKGATTTDFANSAVTSQNGVSIPAGDSRRLWLQFKAPTVNSVAESQRIVITVGVMPP